MAEAAEARYRKARLLEIGLARIYAFLKEIDRTLYWTRQALENLDPHMIS